MNRGSMIYEGKAKKLYAVDDEDLVLIHYKDDATAFNGEKKGSILGKGEMNNSITALIFSMLEKKGVKTHFVEKISPREQLCKKTEIIPLEVIVRNVVAGSMAKRFGLEEGLELSEPVYELSYKKDELGDPPMNDYHAVGLGIASWDDLEIIYRYARRVNEVLRSFFLEMGIRLIDFKLEFGRHRGEILLADEISPDTCRFWDAETGEKLDKDRFRRDLGNVEEAYRQILGKIEAAAVGGEE
ncbi:MAG TPA: phosphoribosylaminoimidazolesuccinocarboxamide synthase [Sediminispirochaeta sp.]|nr:phosphoribosylaminoimidazolesuccinocarboxamide synthase [Sediminispirochaeta sp.]